MTPAHGRLPTSATDALPIREAEELLALHETALGLSDGLHLSTLLETIVERACALVSTAHGYLYLEDPDRRTLSVRVGSGIFADSVGYRLGWGDGLAGRVWASGEPLVVDDYGAWSERRRDLGTPPFHAVVGVPLLAGSRVTGVLGLAYLETGRRFERADIALLGRLGQLASIALENARLYAAVQGELDERKRAEEELADTVAPQAVGARAPADVRGDAVAARPCGRVPERRDRPAHRADEPLLRPAHPAAGP
jgi:GAF domain-containing protein